MAKLGKRVPAHVLHKLVLASGKLREEMTQKDLEALCAEINAAVTNQYFSKHGDVKNFRSCFSPPKKEEPRRQASGKTTPNAQAETHQFICAKTLWRYFNGANYTTKKLNALLCYLGIDHNKFREYLGDTDQDEKKSYADLLHGGWYAYVYDGSEPSASNEKTTRSGQKVKRTPLFIDFKAGKAGKDECTVEYRTAWNLKFTGRGFIRADSLCLELKNQNTHIYLCAKLPAPSEKTQNSVWILNAGGLTNNGLSGMPVMARVVLVKSGKAEARNKDKFIEKEIKIVEYKNSPSQQRLDQSVSEADVNEIIVYLSRHQDTSLRLIIPNDFNKLAERNRDALRRQSRGEYKRLKDRWAKPTDACNWFSFTRTLPKDGSSNAASIAAYEWHFLFDDAQQKCIAFRHKVGNHKEVEFRGELTLKDEKIYMQLEDPANPRIKQFIAPLHRREGEITKLLGVSSTVSINDGWTTMAIREILVFMPRVQLTEDDKRIGYLSYDRFIQTHLHDLKKTKKGLERDDLIYIANRETSILTYPPTGNANNSYCRQKRASDYAGEYCILLVSQYPQAKRVLLKARLTIDEMAQVMLEVKYRKEDDVCVYYGFCEYYGFNLRVSVHLYSDYLDKQKHCELLFDRLEQDDENRQQRFTGLAIDTTNRHQSIAYQFVCLHKDFLKSNTPKTENDPDLFEPHEEEYKHLDRLFLQV